MAVTTRRSLLDYDTQTKSARARARCKVCKLPPEVRAQIKAARETDVRTTTIIEWLRTEYKAELKIGEFATHSNGRHEGEK